MAGGQGRYREANKKYFWKTVGPFCRLCGYDRCVSAVQLHHLDESQKVHRLDSLGYWLSLSRLGMLRRIVCTRFTVLCSNCHIELHTKMRNGEIVCLKEINTTPFNEEYERIKHTGRKERKNAKIYSKTKTCTKCSTDKPKSEFHRNKSMVDGLAGWCKQCNAELPSPKYPPNYFENRTRATLEK